MKKGFLSLAMLFLIAITSFAEGRAKYVFYFIGDGMGVNQVNGTETYLAALQGRICHQRRDGLCRRWHGAVHGTQNEKQCARHAGRPANACHERGRMGPAERSCRGHLNKRFC